MNNQDRVDGAIKARNVLVIDGMDGSNLGVMPLYKALVEARERGINLVQVANGQTPTCKLMDYGKYKFEESKKAKAAQKKQRESMIEEKEIIISNPDIALNDLKIKAKKTMEFLQEGDRVKVTIRCMDRRKNNPVTFRKTFEVFMSLLGSAASEPLQNEFNGRLSWMVTNKKEESAKNK